MLGLAVVFRILCWRSGYHLPGFFAAFYWVVAAIGIIPAAIIGSIGAAVDRRNKRIERMERSIDEIERRSRKVGRIYVDARTFVNDGRQIVILDTTLEEAPNDIRRRKLAGHEGCQESDGRRGRGG